jgi:hypothetical protein
VESRENKKTQTDYNIALLSQEIRMLPLGKEEFNEDLRLN